MNDCEGISFGHDQEEATCFHLRTHWTFLFEAVEKATTAQQPCNRVTSSVLHKIPESISRTDSRHDALRFAPQAAPGTCMSVRSGLDIRFHRSNRYCYPRRIQADVLTVTPRTKCERRPDNAPMLRHVRDVPLGTGITEEDLRPAARSRMPVRFACRYCAPLSDCAPPKQPIFRWLSTGAPSIFAFC